MEFLKNIRLKIGRSVLRSRSSSVRRLKNGFDFDKVSTIGVLWDSTNEDDIIHIANLNRKMTEAGKDVEVLTWVPGKSVPDRLTGLSYMNFIRSDNLNWMFIPKSDDVVKFINKRFDLLIAVNPSSVFPLIYISSVSATPMKVGPDISEEPEKAPYDLMIQAGQPFDTATFIEQVLTYLAMISNPVTRA